METSDKQEILSAIGVLSEGHQEVLDAIGVLADSVQSEMTEVKDRLTFVENRFDGLEKKVDGLDKKVDGVDKKVDGLEKKVDGFNTTMVTKGYLDEKLADLKGDLITLSRKSNTKFSVLIENLVIQGSLKRATADKILAMEPFPQA